MKGHQVRWHCDPDRISFPTEGPLRLLSDWVDAFESGVFEYVDGKGAHKTGSLKKYKGASLGAAIRYNVVPTSVNSASLQVQVFPRSLECLKKSCGNMNMDIRSPDIPALTFLPHGAQVRSLKK